MVGPDRRWSQPGGRAFRLRAGDDATPDFGGRSALRPADALDLAPPVRLFPCRPVPAALAARGQGARLCDRRWDSRLPGGVLDRPAAPRRGASAGLLAGRTLVPRGPRPAAVGVHRT